MSLEPNLHNLYLIGLTMGLGYVGLLSWNKSRNPGSTSKNLRSPTQQRRPSHPQPEEFCLALRAMDWNICRWFLGIGSRARPFF
jgi:hypothetical protein